MSQQPGSDGPRITRVRAIRDWFLADRATGRLVVAQFPNLSLWLFLAARGAQLILESLGWAQALWSPLQWIGTLALAWWALDELARGVNPFRRLLGLFGLVFVTRAVLAGLGLA
jgi:hypothetical protein